MRGPHNIFRLIRVGATMARTGAMGVFFDTFSVPAQIRWPVHLLCSPISWLGHRGDLSLPPVPRALTALGPVYIKYGQILSTRPDIVGIALAKELRFLQDRLPPFSRQEVIAALNDELGQPWDEVFETLSEPVAAASIAQVHKARLKKNGQDIAVKILRPAIEKAFRKDLDAFYFAASVFELLSPEARRLRLYDTIAYFDSCVIRELDLRVEAAAASEFSALTESDEKVYVPKTDFALSTRRMLLMEWVDGIPLGNLEALEDAGYDLKEIGSRVLQMFLNHALRDGYFHADMHQGNLMVGENGKIIVIDFGIMGRIDDYTRQIYAEILYGFIKRDYRRVSEAHFEAGYVSSEQDIDEFAQALRAVGEPIFGMDAEHISMARLLAHLFEVTERFGMKTRTELIALQRTMVVAEGVARSLNPELNIWEEAHPIVYKYVSESIGPKAVLNNLMRTARILLRFSPYLPELTETLLIKQRAEKTVQAKSKKPNRWAWLALGLILGGGVVAALGGL